jgi:GAF domain-containing protein
VQDTALKRKQTCLVLRTTKQEAYDAVEGTAVLTESVKDFDILRTMLAKILKAIQELSGCASVAIRLHSHGDFPYFIHADFPELFVRKETSLTSKAADGHVEVDADGTPVVECMCGNVLKRRFNPDFSFFTAKGSFWTNSTTTLLSTMTDQERREVGRTRNTCHHFGYESLALIPLQAAGVILGLIQLNDPRENMFTLTRIEQYEGIADHVGIIVTRLVEATDQMAHLFNLVAALKGREA